MEEIAADQVIVCSQCSTNRKAKPTSRGLLRVPMGWKRLGESVYCAMCWRKRYRLGVVIFPVSGPVDGEWSELSDALRACWGQSTALANWTVRQLALRDHCRMPGDEKMPKLERVYLYPEARRLFPDLDARSVVSILQAVEKRYRKRRYASIWLSEEALPTYRYPYEYPLPADQWEACYSEEGNPQLRLRLGGHWRSLALWGGRVYDFRKTDFEALASSGKELRGTLGLYRVRANANDASTTVQDRLPGGGSSRQYWRVMAKLVGWIPRQEITRRRVKKMTLIAGGEHFLSAEVPGRQPWVINADHITARIQSHARFLQRVAEDMKHEKRWPKPVRQQTSERTRLRVAKHHRRLNDWAHELTAQTASFADRQEIKEVVLDDENAPDGYPWARLWVFLGYKLSGLGIRLMDASGEVMNGEEAAETVANS